ncbi:MAG: hypothetical protein ACKO97_06875, partial [Actinomycetota bacterium]
SSTVVVVGGEVVVVVVEFVVLVVVEVVVLVDISVMSVESSESAVFTGAVVSPSIDVSVAYCDADCAPHAVNQAHAPNTRTLLSFTL